MCSRFSLTSPPEAVRAIFAYRDTPNFPVRYNIAPTQDIGAWCASTPTANAAAT
jgi:putative SOS response-associated peptidase YedK